MYEQRSFIKKLIGILTWSSLVLLVPLAILGFLSESALPENPLYPLKRTIENMVVGFGSFNQYTLALYKLSLVSTRFLETKQLYADKTILVNTSEINDFISQIETARNTINAINNTNERNTLRQKLIQQIVDYRNQLTILQTQSPFVSPQPFGGTQPTANQTSQTSQNSFWSQSQTDQNVQMNQLQQELQDLQNQLQQELQNNSGISPTPTQSTSQTSSLTLFPSSTLIPTPIPTVVPSPTSTPASSHMNQNGKPPVPTSQPGNSSPPPVTKVIIQDTFQRVNQSGWGIASDGNAWGADFNSPSYASINNNVGQVTNVNASSAYGSTYAGILGPMMTDAEVLFSGKANIFANASQYIGFGAMLRYADSNNFYRGYITGSYAIITKKVGGVLTILSQVPYSASTNTLYSIRFRVKGSALFLKVWQSATAEPSNWTISTADNSVSGPGYCGIRVTMEYPSQIFSFPSFQATQL